MQEPPRRLRRLSASRPRILRLSGKPGEPAGEWPPLPPRRHVLRQLRAARRIATLLLWTLVAIPVQAVLLLIPGNASIRFARIYWAMICRLLGFRVRVIGRAAEGDGTRPILFASNHSSWLDVAVLGGRLDAAFVAKDAIARWPLINVVAKLGRTVFVSRQLTNVRREKDLLAVRLAAGKNLVLFPEGTSSDGSRVLPFRSAFFAVVDNAVTADGARPIVQPISLVYDRLGYLPTGRASRPLFAWYGEMNLASHVWRLAQYRGLRATVLLHAPMDPAAFPNRKALAVAVHAAVADGAATLRQNRPARPLAGLSGVAEEGAEPAFA